MLVASNLNERPTIMSNPIPDVTSVQSVHAQSGASMAMPLYPKISALFSQIDTSGSGSISQSQFQEAFATQSKPARFQAAGADAIWAQLDPSKTGSVSRQDFVQGIAKLSAALKSNGTAAAAVPSAAKTVAGSLAELGGSQGVDLSA